jgi:hypothetical protein
MTIPQAGEENFPASEDKTDRYGNPATPNDEDMFPGYHSDEDTVDNHEEQLVAKHIKDGGIFSTFKTKVSDRADLPG